MFYVITSYSIHYTKLYDVLWTNKKCNCGLDFSKAVIILNENEYIDTKTRPYIRPDEFEVLRGKEYIIKTKMIKYIHDYKEAKCNLSVQRNKYLCEFSTLQYFEEYLNEI